MPALATTFPEVQASNVTFGARAASSSQFTSVICEGSLQSTTGLAEGVHFLHIIPKTERKGKEKNCQFSESENSKIEIRKRKSFWRCGIYDSHLTTFWKLKDRVAILAFPNC